MGFFKNLFKNRLGKRKSDATSQSNIPGWEREQLKSLPDIKANVTEAEATEQKTAAEVPTNPTAESSDNAAASSAALHPSAQSPDTEKKAPERETLKATETNTAKETAKETPKKTTKETSKETIHQPENEAAKAEREEPKAKKTPSQKPKNDASRSAASRSPSKPTQKQTTKAENDGEDGKKESDQLLRAGESMDAAKTATRKAATHLKTAKNLLEMQDEEAEAVDAIAQPIEVRGVPKGKFEIKKARDGRYVFNLFAANHSIVATSQIYASAQSALNGINSVIANAERAGIEDQTLKNYVALPYPKWEIFTDKGGGYRFRLNAPNGSCICHSQGYTTKSACKNGIESIIRNSKLAEVDKAYLKKDENKDEK